MKSARYRFVFVLAGVALALHAGGCGKPHESAEAESAAADTLITLPRAALAEHGVRVESIHLEAVADTIELKGQVEVNPLRVAHVAPRVSGTVERVYTIIGDRVARGRIVATLMSPEFAAAQGDYLLAHRRAEDAQPQPGADIGSLRAIAESSRRKLETLGAAPADLAELDRTHQPLPSLPLRSPLSGVVTEIEASAGKQVSVGTDVFGVANLDEVWGVVDAYERDFGRLRVGQSARLSATAYPGREFAGEIASLEGSVKEATRTLSVRLRVPNHGLLLKPGMFLAARVATGQVRQAIVLDDGVLQEFGGQPAVFVAVNDTTFMPRAVELRPLSGGRVEVLGGLRPGDRIAMDGAFLLKSQASRDELGEE